MTEHPGDASATAADPVDPFVALRRAGLDPVPELTRLREGAPVCHVEFPFGIGAWIVSGYDVVKAVLGDSKASPTTSAG